MSTEEVETAATIGAEVTLCEEVPMVRRERWEEIRRLWVAERVPIVEIARRLDVDRKTVRRQPARTAPLRVGDREDSASVTHKRHDLTHGCEKRLRLRIERRVPLFPR